MSYRQEEPEQQDSDERSFDGSWKSKTSSSHSSLSDNEQQQQQQQPQQPPPSNDRLESDLVEYLLKYKDELNLKTIKSLHESLNKLVKSEPDDKANGHIARLEQAKKLAEEELEVARKEADAVKHKYKQLQEQLKKELGAFDELRIDNILKNTGGAAYVDSLRSVIKTKDAAIKSQSATIKQLERDNDNLEERLRKAKRLIDDQRTAIQQAHLQAQVKPNDFELDRRRNLSHQGSVRLGMSPEPQYDSNHDGYPIPLPPRIGHDEILSLVNSPQDPHMTSANSSSNNGISFLKKSISPPPMIDVSLEEILGGMSESNGSMAQGYASP